MNKFLRANFLKDEEVEGIVEKDLVHNYWNLFKIQRTVSYATITRNFIMRPDLLSLAQYGTMKYWWILLKVNDIDDIWYDFHIGDVIMVPDVQDIEDWLLAVTAQKRRES